MRPYMLQPTIYVYILLCLYILQYINESICLIPYAKICYQNENVRPTSLLFGGSNTVFYSTIIAAYFDKSDSSDRFQIEKNVISVSATSETLIKFFYGKIF